MKRLNASGRTYVKGRPLSADFRASIIDEILRNGGDIHTGYFPGRLEDVAKRFKVSSSCVENLWGCLSRERTIEPRRHGGGNPTNLTQGDLQLIETCKKTRPSSSLKEIQDVLNEFGDIPNGTSISAVSRSLSNNMLSGLKYSRKKISNFAQERFSVENMAYTQMFIDYLHAKNPCKLKFFDECGLKLPFHGKRLYGHAPIGERCVEFIRYHESPNITVNLLAGLNGVEYMNTVHGASDTIDFLHFFGEAGNAVNIETERPALEVGDIVVMDNCPTHHFAGGEALQEWLSDRNIELVYTPTYSPDFNPAEFVFNKMRSVMRYDLWELTNENIELSAVTAAEDYITSDNMMVFFRYTSYINV